MAYEIVLFCFLTLSFFLSFFLLLLLLVDFHSDMQHILSKMKVLRFLGVALCKVDSRHDWHNEVQVRWLCLFLVSDCLFVSILHCLHTSAILAT
jgi:hypothetical protein